MKNQTQFFKNQFGILIWLSHFSRSPFSRDSSPSALDLLLPRCLPAPSSPPRQTRRPSSSRWTAAPAAPSPPHCPTGCCPRYSWTPRRALSPRPGHWRPPGREPLCYWHCSGYGLPGRELLILQFYNCSLKSDFKQIPNGSAVEAKCGCSTFICQM